MNIKSKVLSFSLAATTIVSMAAGTVTASAATNVKEYNVKNLSWSYTEPVINYNSKTAYTQKRFKIKLKWKAVAGATKYDIFYINPENSANRKIITTKEQNYCIIQNLLPGKIYRFAIRTHKNGSTSQLIPKTIKYEPDIKMTDLIPLNNSDSSCGPASMAMILNYRKRTNYTAKYVFDVAEKSGLLKEDPKSGEVIGMKNEDLATLAKKFNCKGVVCSTRTEKDAIKIIDSQLIRNNPVIIGANNISTTDGDLNKDSHFVVIYGKNFDSQDNKYYVADSYGGKRRTWDGKLGFNYDEQTGKLIPISTSDFYILDSLMDIFYLK